MRKIYSVFIIITAVFSFFSCRIFSDSAALRSAYLKIEFNHQMYSRVRIPSKTGKPLMSAFQPSEYLITEGGALKDFALEFSRTESFSDSIGRGQKLVLRGAGVIGDAMIQKEITVKIYDDFPTMAVFRVVYTNTGKTDIFIKKWRSHEYTIDALSPDTAFWSFQSGSYEDRPDWVRPVTRGFFQQNFMGMNAPDYGGGTPVTDLWRRDAGLAVGHVAKTPKLVSLPVAYDSSASGAAVAVDMQVNQRLKPGESLETLPTFVAVHHGDYFAALKTFSRFMQKQGIRFPEYPGTAYEPVWCAWGYERNFTVSEILNTLPEVKKLGLKWVVLDDGWQTAEGDWYLNPKKFPRGDADMRRFVKKIHSMGLKAKLWLTPLAADPGTVLLKNQPDLLLLDEDGSPQTISWWDSYYLCPAYEPTREYTRRLIIKILKDWDFDGLKLDGQHQNQVPLCFNPAHRHAQPTESVEHLPDYFQLIYETAKAIKPDAVVEICPCGDACSFYNMPYMNRPVASDPTSSWQIRLKGKTYKALMGADVPYYGDHVGLSDGREDFASTIGIGGVPGTKFTWPPGVYVNTESGDVSLTPEKETKWQKWLALYERHQISKGVYLGRLYDIGFDRPEGHVVRKGDTLFYAFYAPDFSGKVDLRGLEKEAVYSVYDYEHEINLGTITGAQPFIQTKFKNHLLLKVFGK